MKFAFAKVNSMVILSILTLLILGSCSKNKTVTLESEDGTHKLTYSCNNFRHQAKTGKDIRVIMKESAKAMRESANNGDVVNARAFYEAIKIRDFRRLEELIVEYKCQVKYK